MNLNKVTLIGRLTRDPELRTTNSGSTVASISIATNSHWTDKSGQKQENTEFHNIVLFGKVAEVAGQYLIKGQEAYFEGRLQTRTYTGKDNIERRVTEVVADTMQFGAKPQGAGNNAQSNQATAPVAANQSAPATNQSAQPEAEEDIPTINLDEEKDDVKIEDVPF
jgi:single-strand DNA-binding protein